MIYFNSKPKLDNNWCEVSFNYLIRMVYRISINNHQLEASSQVKNSFNFALHLDYEMFNDWWHLYLTPRLSELDIVQAVGRDSWVPFSFFFLWLLLDSLWKSAFENQIFLVSRNFFSWIWISKMGVKMIIQDNNEKSWSWFKNNVPPKIDFRAVGTHESYPTAWELKLIFTVGSDVSKKLASAEEGI